LFSVLNTISLNGLRFVVEETICPKCSDEVHQEIVDIPAQVVAYGYHGGVHEGDASTAPEGVEVQEEHHLEEHPALQFHEAVVGHRIREVTLEVDADEVQVVVLEIVECAEMEHNQNRHNLDAAAQALDSASYYEVIDGNIPANINLILRYHKNRPAG